MCNIRCVHFLIVINLALILVKMGSAMELDKDNKRKICREHGPRCPSDTYSGPGPERWHYQAGFGCRSYASSGCEETENSFDTLEECNRRCKGIKPCPLADALPDCEVHDMGFNEDGCREFKFDCRNRNKARI